MLLRIASTKLPQSHLWLKPSSQQYSLARLLSIQRLTSNIDFVTNEKVEIRTNNGTPIVQMAEPKPLTVILSWLMAQEKHLIKYSDIYLKKGFNVLKVKLSPKQLAWPETGAQVVAQDLLKILHKNTQCNPVVIHGFSVGGYLWGEVLLRIQKEPEKYEHLMKRVAGQVWDSAADVTEIPHGFPYAVFPRNTVMRNLLKSYIMFHMWALENKVTRHYRNSSACFYKPAIRAPALFVVSERDPIGSTKANIKVRDSWNSLGMTTHWKCWNDSKHVSHFLKHPEEYLDVLNNFLNTLDLNPK